MITTDVGQHQMWAAQFYRTREGRHWISSGGAGTMGFGFPAAIGAQFARPEEEVWAIVGDGGFQMTMCELATAPCTRCRVKILIINNHYLGMVRQWQELFYENRLSGVDLEGNPDFVKLAEAYGVKGLRIRRPGDIDRKLREARAHKGGPVLVVAEVDEGGQRLPDDPGRRADREHDHRASQASSGEAQWQHLSRARVARPRARRSATTSTPSRSTSTTSRACWCASRWCSRDAATTSRAWW